MATTAAMPKTILITLPAASVSNTNFVQCQPKVGQKRTFSIVSPVVKSPSPPAVASSNWLPATVHRTYKYETVDDDYDYDDSEDQQSQYTDSDQPPRKRERLTHLSAEEKMFRRKMKNRIAAQTARDRKKALMMDLEETVRRLEEENDTLVMENSKLRQEQSSLADENERLKKKLAEQQQAKSDGQEGARVVSAFGPAESICVPLPKEQAKPTCALTWLVASALIQLYSRYCVSSLPKEEQQRMVDQLEQLKENSSLTLEDVISRSPPEAIDKLRSIIRCYKTASTKPP